MTTTTDGVPVDRGPWSVVQGVDGKPELFSDDFEHDVKLRISGDFADDQQRMNYATALAAQLNATPGVDVPVAPKLTVWVGPMPESNGKTNWTAILHRGDLVEGFTIARSEHHDRVRYEADKVRWLIGETGFEPDILMYDPDMLSPPGYVHPCGVQGTQETKEIRDA